MKKVEQIFPVLPLPADDFYRGGLPVRGRSQWQKISRANNHLIGRGSTLFAGGPHATTIGATTGYQTAVWPTPEMHTRVWFVTLGHVITGSTDNTWITGSSFGTLQCSDATGLSTAVDWTLVGVGPQVFKVSKENSSPGSAEEPLSVLIAVDSSSPSAPHCLGVTCVEVPRVLIPDESMGDVDNGTHEESCSKGWPIHGEDPDLSYGSAFSHTHTIKTAARRRSLFSFFSPTGVTVTTTTYTTITLIEPSVLGRLIRSSDTLRTVKWNVYGSANTAGDVKLTMTNGDTSTISVSGGTADWQTAGTIDIDADQMNRLATDGGIRGGTRDDITIEARQTSGTSIFIQGISMAEDGT